MGRWFGSDGNSRAEFAFGRRWRRRKKFPLRKRLLALGVGLGALGASQVVGGAAGKAVNKSLYGHLDNPRRR